MHIRQYPPADNLYVVARRILIQRNERWIGDEQSNNIVVFLADGARARTPTALTAQTADRQIKTPL